MPHVPQLRYHPMLRIFSLLPLLEKFNIVVLLLSRCRRHGITESVGRSSGVTAHKMRCIADTTLVRVPKFRFGSKYSGVLRSPQELKIIGDPIVVRLDALLIFCPS